VDVQSAETLKQVLPQCQLKIIEGAGHLPFEETPEEFNRLVLDFIDQDFIDQQKAPPGRGTICKAL